MHHLLTSLLSTAECIPNLKGHTDLGALFTGSFVL